MSPPPSEITKLLEQRFDCLQALADTPYSKPDLVEVLDIPRSTLDDIIRELENARLVEYRDGKWCLTVFGQSALETHTDYHQRLDSLVEAAPIIKELPYDTPVDCRFLVDADVHSASSVVPDEVIQVFLDAVESAAHIRGFTPIVMTGYAEAFYQNATTGDQYKVEVVLPTEVFVRVRELYPDQTDEAMADGKVTFYNGEVPVSFSLWIADDDHAGIVVYAEHGVKGVLKNDTEEALRWATEQYNRIKSDADPYFYRGKSVYVAECR